MFSRTSVPRGTRFPACGRCATTVFFGWFTGTRKTVASRPTAFSSETAAARLWPTTFGTRVGPRETRIVTVEPFATGDPAAGLCASTLPGALVDATLTVCASSPWARSARIAGGALSPTTFGTVTSAAEGVDRVTTDPFVTCVPGPGCWAKTIPAGSELGFATRREVSPAP